MDIDIEAPEFAQFLDKLIDQKARAIVQQELQKYGVLHVWDAIVTSVSGNTASVKLIGESKIIPDLKNKTNQVLVAGDEVQLHSPSSLTNAYIGIAKHKPV